MARFTSGAKADRDVTPAVFQEDLEKDFPADQRDIMQWVRNHGERDPDSLEAQAAFIDAYHGLVGRRILRQGRATVLMVYLPGADSKKIKWFDRFQRESATAEFTADSLAAVYQLDVVDLLSSVCVPTVVIHRQKERVMPFRQGRELAASIPNARFVPLEGNIHAPWLGDRESVLQTICAYGPIWCMNMMRTYCPHPRPP